MEASPLTVRAIARRLSAALAVGAVAAAGAVGMSHTFAGSAGGVSHACLTGGGTAATTVTGAEPACSAEAAAATWSRSDRANVATPARKGHDPAAGSTQFQTISASFTAPNFETKILLCPSATPFVVGGGAQVVTPNLAVLSRSYPISGPVPADGWAAAGWAFHGTRVTLVLYAICTA